MRFWTGTIAGVTLEDGAATSAGFELTGADAFEYLITGNSVQSINGTAQTQYSEFTGDKPLELKFLHIPKTLLTSVLTALKATLPGGTKVACTFTDGYQTITGNFKPNVPQWYERGLPDGDYINDAIIRLIGG